jgi:hypothetical protein
MRGLEKQLYELSCIEFDSYEELEEWVEKNFKAPSGAEWPFENQVAFLVCDHRLLLVFEFRNGKWRFSQVEITGYAINEEEGDFIDVEDLNTMVF